MVRKVYGTNGPWYEWSTRGTKSPWYEQSMVRIVYGTNSQWYERSMGRMVHGTNGLHVVRKVRGTNSQWYEKSRHPTVHAYRNTTCTVSGLCPVFLPRRPPTASQHCRSTVFGDRGECGWEMSRTKLDLPQPNCSTRN